MSLRLHSWGYLGRCGLATRDMKWIQYRHLAGNGIAWARRSAEIFVPSQSIKRTVFVPSSGFQNPGCRMTLPSLQLSLAVHFARSIQWNGILRIIAIPGNGPLFIIKFIWKDSGSKWSDAGWMLRQCYSRANFGWIPTRPWPSSCPSGAPRGSVNSPQSIRLCNGKRIAGFYRV